jgi:hypothetical protein
MNNLSPRGEIWMGVFLMFCGVVSWTRAHELTWAKGQQLERWQSKAAFFGLLLAGAFLIAHAIVRKLR